MTELLLGEQQMLTALAILYFLGIFLHFTHVITVIVLTDNEPNMMRVISCSMVWPLMTVWYFYTLVLKGDDEDEY